MSEHRRTSQSHRAALRSAHEPQELWTAGTGGGEPSSALIYMQHARRLDTIYSIKSPSDQLCAECSMQICLCAFFTLVNLRVCRVRNCRDGVCSDVECNIFKSNERWNFLHCSHHLCSVLDFIAFTDQIDFE